MPESDSITSVHGTFTPVPKEQAAADGPIKPFQFLAPINTVFKSTMNYFVIVSVFANECFSSPSNVNYPPSESKSAQNISSPCLFLGSTDRAHSFVSTRASSERVAFRSAAWTSPP